MSRAPLRSAVSCHSIRSRRVFHASQVDSQLSETSTDTVVEGAYVELKTEEMARKPREAKNIIYPRDETTSSLQRLLQT